MASTSLFLPQAHSIMITLNGIARRILPNIRLWGLAAIVITTGCGSQNSAPDVSKINVDLKTYRFDVDLYSIDTNHIADGLKKLEAKYPDFLDYYLDTIREYNIRRNFTDTVGGIREGLKTDLTFRDFVHLEDTIKLTYPDTKATDAALLSGFRYMKYYYPSYTVPRIYYLNMGLSMWPTFPRDTSTLCIGLDMFLGDGFPHYASFPNMPGYLASHRRKHYIPVSLFSTIYKMAHPWHTDDKTLLELMIERGKEQYFLHRILPGEPDSVLFGFTQSQLKWCAANEGLIYNFFIQQNLLYNKEAHNVIPFVNDGPFAHGLDDGSNPSVHTPGNIGTWMGYRIVSSWMEQNPKTSLAELTNTKHDPARFLDAAKYRPGK